MVNLKCYHCGSDRLARNGLTQNGKQRYLCSACGRVVAYVVGDRSAATCQKLWSRSRPLIARLIATPTSGRRTGQSSPAEQHTAAGKQPGLTAHVELWNNTLRQRLGRFVRKSLSFSKSEAMHELCLRLFLHDYNHSMALSYD